MAYRDPREALQAENDCLRQELRDAHEEVEALRSTGGPSPRAALEGERQRWAFGMRCLGGVAMMLPFFLMTAVCERRVTRVPHPAFTSAMLPTGVAPAQSPAVPTSNVQPNCAYRSSALGFERFTQAVERPARVSRASHWDGVSVNDLCTVRVVPVSMVDFNCHVEVACAGRTLYGALPTGYTHCDVEGASPLRAMDAEHTGTDGDAAVTVDFTTRSAVLEDRSGATLSRLEFTLLERVATR